jgi:ubiquinone/menaquinone biosynthesis C-methylase UbiE
MSQRTRQPGTTSHRLFAAYYERLSHGGTETSYMEPLRREIIGQARGLVIEIGAGNGLNFAFYDPRVVERVEAIDPDSAMLRYAQQRVKTAPVPLTLTRVPVERLPFSDESFDSAVCTLVFCSVSNPLLGLHEVRRVLKADGMLLMLEHVRAQGRIISSVQHIVTPVTRLCVGNCHWNRDTAWTVRQAGFQAIDRRDLGGGLLPMVMLRASKE